MSVRSCGAGCALALCTRSVAVTDLRDEAGLFRVIEIDRTGVHPAFLGRDGFGGLENEACAVLDAHAFFAACHRVPDRLEAHGCLIAELRAAVLAVEIELEADELRIEEFRDDSGENFKRHAAVSG